MAIRPDATGAIMVWFIKILRARVRSYLRCYSLNFRYGS